LLELAVNNDRCNIININSQNPLIIINETINLLEKKYKKNIFKKLDKHDLEIANEYFQKINNFINEKREEYYNNIVKIIGKNNTNKLLKIGGFESRIHLIPKSLDRLKKDYEITGKNLVTFMCDSVASRLNNINLYKELNKLKDEEK
jgi:hypothetical protein